MNVDCEWDGSEATSADCRCDAVGKFCPRRQCRGWLDHSWIRHWFGWVRR